MLKWSNYQANTSLFKVTIETPEKHTRTTLLLLPLKSSETLWFPGDCRGDLSDLILVFGVNFEYISHLFLEFLLLTLNK